MRLYRTRWRWYQPWRLPRFGVRMWPRFGLWRGFWRVVGDLLDPLGKEFEARAAIDRARKLHQPENGCDNPVHTVPDATCPQCCDYCQCCGEAMPCATIRAIDGEGR